MTEFDGLDYEHTDEEALKIGTDALKYIFDGGDETVVPIAVHGMAFYGVVAALRENDHILHAEPSILEESALRRLQQVEDLLEEADRKGKQFYPFGFSRTPEAREISTDALSMVNSWGTFDKRPVTPK
jgi:hypothetical protein